MVLLTKDFDGPLGLHGCAAAKTGLHDKAAQCVSSKEWQKVSEAKNQFGVP